MSSIIQFSQLFYIIECFIKIRWLFLCCVSIRLIDKRRYVKYWKTLIYRRAVFLKTGQLNELGGYKPRTSGRRTCKFYILKSFRVFYMSFFYFFSIYKSANAFFLLRLLGYPVPFEARIYHVYTDTHIYTHARTSSLRTQLIVHHTETCIHWTYLSNLSCIFLNSTTDYWVDTFCVVKFFHEHFCFTFSYDVFRLFWPPEMTVYINNNEFFNF